MKNKLLATLLLVMGILLLIVGEYFLINNYVCKDSDVKEENTPQAMMLLIEFTNTDGLINMVNDMQERDVKGLLMVNADFVEKNKVAIKEILQTGVVEIAPSYSAQPYWGMSYEQQYNVISDMVTRIEEALDINVRIISSKYMASDENTVKVAQDLGIEYITARGTTELATTVYKPQEYDVKVISVSNIDVPEFKYGSFCDYSFYERSGSPEDMTREFERATEKEKFIGVSHTYIGGYKARWNDMWHNFWDNYEVEWVDLDTLGSVDKTMPMWQIPINKNAPYTPEKIRPAIPYEQEENVDNPCKVGDLNEENTSSENNSNTQVDTVIVFHNNTGPMCLEMLDFLKENSIPYEEHLTTDTDFSRELNSYKTKVPVSEGVSTTFGYYPMIFIGDRAFSGFNATIEGEIIDLLDI